MAEKRRRGLITVAGRRFKLLEKTPVLGLPTLQANVDESSSLPGESRAILIRGTATDVLNPLKPLLGVGPDAYISFAKLEYIRRGGFCVKRL